MLIQIRRCRAFLNKYSLSSSMCWAVFLVSWIHQQGNSIPLTTGAYILVRKRLSATLQRQFAGLQLIIEQRKEGRFSDNLKNGYRNENKMESWGGHFRCLLQYFSAKSAPFLSSDFCFLIGRCFARQDTSHSQELFHSSGDRGYLVGGLFYVSYVPPKYNCTVYSVLFIDQMYHE